MLEAGGFDAEDARQVFRIRARTVAPVPDGIALLYEMRRDLGMLPRAAPTAGAGGAVGTDAMAASVLRRLPTGSQPSRPESVARTRYCVVPAQPGRQARIATSSPSKLRCSR